MTNKKYSPGQAVVKPRQIDVLPGEGKSINQACKEHGRRPVRLLCIIDEYTRETLAIRVERSIGAQVVVEQWRREYNTVRLHSSLGYRPPAPAAINPQPPVLEQVAAMR